jgi:beta-glucosidase
LLRGIQEGFNGRVVYAYGCHHFNNWDAAAWCEHPTNEAIIAAREADAVIMCMGLTPEIEGEQADDYNGAFSGDKATIELPEVQIRLLKKIAAEGKPIVFVNVSGSCMNLCDADELCSAVVQCFYPGAEGGHALCDMLLGKISPSGRLPVTFYRSTEDLPPMDDYSMENRTYKFFRGEPLYPFGHGLSYADVKEAWQDEKTVRITNSSDIETDYSILRYEYKPYKSLADFKKIHLDANAEITVAFE